MAKPFTQQLFSFDDPPKESSSSLVPYQPSQEARAAFHDLEFWLSDARGRPMTEMAEETLIAVRKAILEGKHGFLHKAEDLLLALQLRNGLSTGDDIPNGKTPTEGDSIHKTVEAVLDELGEMTKRHRSVSVLAV
jgi:hypothetical protein